MTVFAYLSLFLAVLLGGAAGAGVMNARLSEEKLRSFLPLLLSFSGAYLLGIAALEMIPEVFREGGSEMGVYLLGGFFLQLVLEGFSQGVEHGHIHAHRQSGYVYAVQIMVGLGVHAFLEGLPVAMDTGGLEAHAGHHHSAVGNHLLFGILMHKLPAAFSLAVLLRASDYSRRFTWGALFLFACLSPLGTLVGAVFSFSHIWIDRILALVVGSFLHISTTILFEADGKRSHSISPRKFLVIVSGMILAWLTTH